MGMNIDWSTSAKKIISSNCAFNHKHGVWQMAICATCYGPEIVDISDELGDGLDYERAFNR